MSRGMWLPGTTIVTLQVSLLSHPVGGRVDGQWLLIVMGHESKDGTRMEQAIHFDVVDTKNGKKLDKPPYGCASREGINNTIAHSK